MYMIPHEKKGFISINRGKRELARKLTKALEQLKNGTRPSHEEAVALRYDLFCGLRTI